MTLTDIPGQETASCDAAPTVRLVVEYWTVAMEEQDSCGSCDATLVLLQDAVTAVRPLADRLGIAIDVVSSKVVTWDEAVEQGIGASPTIRAEGLEMRPTHPDGSETRVWAWRGTTSASPAPEALLDFLAQAVVERSRRLGAYLAEGGPSPYVRRYLRATTPDKTPVSSSCAPSACS